MKRFMRSLALAGTVAVGLLAGCATNQVLDSTVQSFSGLPTLPASPTYRFERLPLQQAQPGQQQVEALADPALFKAGLRRDDASPRLSVQVSARVQRTVSPWADPWDGWGWGPPGYPWGRRWGPGFGAPFPRADQIWFQREVGVVVRDIASNKVVFESRAANDGPWFDNTVVLGAMFEAAMAGFPNPPQGVRRVSVQLVDPKAQVAAPTASAPAAAASAPGR
jgi:hypothetical protein